MFCTKCGNEVREGVVFCPVCGEPVKGSQQNAGAEVPVYAAPAAGSGGSVGFGEAIKLLFQNYANFTGRSTKSEYWWAFLFLWIVNFATAFIPILGTIVSLALLIPNLSLNIRRLHDIGKAWTWILMGLIPVAGFIILIVYYCKDSDVDNQWGRAK